MMNLASIFVFLGILLIIIGALIWVGLPIGKLPGDVQIKGENTQIYFPIMTSIVISVVLTILLNFLFWLRK